MYLFLLSDIFSSPLKNGHDRIGNPFLIYYNPSLICKQTGMPIGGEYLYNYTTGRNVFITGFSETFSASGVSLSYKREDEDKVNTLSTAFSTFYKNISFGSSFHFLFSQSEPVFTFDAGISYHFKEKRYVGLVFNNIFTTDTMYSHVPEAVVCAGGNVPWIDKLYFDFQGIIQFIDIKENALSYGGDLSIQKFFFKGPSLSIYTQGNVLYNTEKKLEWAVKPLLGFHHSFKRFSVGIYAGYEMVYEDNRSNIALSIYFNPLHTKNKKGLSCDIQVSSPVLVFYSDNNTILITITGVFSHKDVTVKRWNLIVTKEKFLSLDAVRAYSGGNIPPSSIVFDGRNIKGELLESGTYYLQLILIDSMNRVVSSSYKKIIIK